MQEYERYLRERQEEQRQAVERLAREAALRDSLDRADRSHRLDDISRLRAQLDALLRSQANALSELERARLIQEVIGLEQVFARERSAYLASIRSYRQRMATAISQIVVPPSSQPRRYDRILFLGMSNTPAMARERATAGEMDPFAPVATNNRDRVFDDVFAFGTPGAGDFGRVALDRALSGFGNLSPGTTAQVAALRGAYADELVCHSNGCTVAQVLIASGQLTVRKLRVLGGDNALADLDYLRSLKSTQRIDEVSVYVMKNDVVPMSGVAWRMMELTHGIGRPLVTYAAKATDLTYQMLGLVPRPPYRHGADIQVRIMTNPAATGILEIHEYDNYRRAVYGLNRVGCLDGGGAVNRRCVTNVR